MTWSTTLLLAQLCLVLLPSQLQASKSQSTNYANILLPRVNTILRPAQPNYIRQWIVLEGRRVVLNCSVELPREVNPLNVTYRWEHPNGEIIGRSKFYIIPQAKVNDAGIYVCHSSALLGLTGQHWEDQRSLDLKVSTFQFCCCCRRRRLRFQ